MKTFTAITLAPRKRYAAFALVVLASFADAADIVHVAYDPHTDQLVLDIAYRGTNGRHRFSVQWGPCAEGRPNAIVGRLLDRQGRDEAREDYRVRVRLGLEELPCRPVRATLRLGRIAHATVFIPEAPR